MCSRHPARLAFKIPLPQSEAALMATPAATIRHSFRPALAFALILPALVLPIRAHAQSEPAHTPKPATPPLDITVPLNPTAFQAAGKWHLVYELHIANLGKW